MPQEHVFASCRRGLPGTVCRYARVEGSPLLSPHGKTVLIRGLSARSTSRCIVLLILNVGTRDE